MEQQVEEYLNNLVAECMQTPAYAILPEDQKAQIGQNLHNHFNQLMINTLVDQLNDAQLMELDQIDVESPQMEEKLFEYASEIPEFMSILEQALKNEVAKITNQPITPSN